MKALLLLPLLLLTACGGGGSGAPAFPIGNYSVVLSRLYEQYDFTLNIESNDVITGEGTFVNPQSTNPTTSVTITGNVTNRRTLNLYFDGAIPPYSYEAHLNIERTDNGFQGFDIYGGAPESLFFLQAQRVE
ncbi:MAG: hypothetical protein KF836_04515 [Fimbriimonadaceae bacterium]|nr:hypothetical protein [Fimbriimonadaceae bacterium]